VTKDSFKKNWAIRSRRETINQLTTISSLPCNQRLIQKELTNQVTNRDNQSLNHNIVYLVTKDSFKKNWAIRSRTETINQWTTILFTLWPETHSKRTAQSGHEQRQSISEPLYYLPCDQTHSKRTGQSGHEQRQSISEAQYCLPCDKRLIQKELINQVSNRDNQSVNRNILFTLWQGWQKPGFFLKKKSPVGFLGFIRFF
jgi:hypothetical protein